MNARLFFLLMLPISAMLTLGWRIQNESDLLVTSQTTLNMAIDKLASEQAVILSSEGKVLGKISKTYDEDSIGNEVGRKGGSMGLESIFNPYSLEGSEFGLDSPFSRVAADPPKIAAKIDGKWKFVAVLTVNKLLKSDLPILNTYNLEAWARN